MAAARAAAASLADRTVPALQSEQEFDEDFVRDDSPGANTGAAASESLQRVRAAWEEAVRNVTETLNALNGQMEEATEAARAANERHQRLSEQAEGMQRNASRARERYERLHEALDAARSRVTSLRNATDEAAQALRDMTPALQAANESYKETEERSERLRGIANQSAAAQDAAWESLEDTRRQAAAASEEVKVLMQKLLLAEAKLEALRDEEPLEQAEQMGQKAAACRAVSWALAILAACVGQGLQ